MLPELATGIPGPRSRKLAAKLRRYESRNVTYLADDFPIFWERAEGTNVWDADGNRFLDLTSAFGVAGLGHTRDEVRRALISQSGALLHAMGDVHPAAVKAELCALLSEVTFERWRAGRGKVVLASSGSDAVEIALKTSMLHTGRPGVIAFTGSYHGLGMGALATTGIPFFREPFRAQLQEFTAFVPFPEGREFPNCSSECLERLRAEIETVIRRDKTGCILVEPVQGRGGCVVPPRDFLPLLRTICDAHGMLLIADEIYTGFNRTGALFACEHSTVVPDLICLGKAIAGGFPLSACVGRSEVMDAWPLSTGEALHTSTFLGNPLGCAMALAAIHQHLEFSVAGHVQERGETFKSMLAALRSPRIGDIRGLGLMIGAELITANGEPATDLALAVVRRALRAGLILLADSPRANVLSFAPPFAIADEEIAFASQVLAEALNSPSGFATD